MISLKSIDKGKKSDILFIGQRKSKSKRKEARNSENV